MTGKWQDRPETDPPQQSRAGGLCPVRHRRKMVDHTTVACNPSDRNKIRAIGEMRNDSNTQETIHFLVERVEFGRKSHEDTDNVGIIVEESN